ncbi:DUF3040 domain-containing protein [Nonomuraea antimicrobica]
MEGLSPQERLILEAIEVELKNSGPGLAHRLDAFNAQAARQGPQRFAAHVSGWEVAGVLAMVVLLCVIMTLLVVSC